MVKQEFIKIRDWPSDHAQKAYDKGYYIEAIQVLHGWIEIQARGLLILLGAVNFNTKVADTWDIVDEMAYKDVIKSLLALGQITKEDLVCLLKINSVRNKIIHRYFKDPYEKIYEGFPKVDYDRVFQEAASWGDKLFQMNEEIIE